MTSGSTVGLIYGLEYQCRSLCSVAADTDNVSFLVGTQGLKLPNQVHHVQLREETQTLSKMIYEHTCGEIWQIASSHSDPSVFATRHSFVDGSNVGALKVGGTVWRMSQHKTPNQYLTGVGQELELICHLRGDQVSLLLNLCFLLLIGESLNLSVRSKQVFLAVLQLIQY